LRETRNVPAPVSESRLPGSNVPKGNPGGSDRVAEWMAFDGAADLDQAQSVNERGKYGCVVGLVVT
jgi:hypothetical protein